MKASVSLSAFRGGYSNNTAVQSLPQGVSRIHWACVRPSQSFSLSVWFTWRKLFVCVYAFLHYRDKEASCSTILLVLGCKAAWAMCLALPWQQRTAGLTDTHGQNIFSPHTHSHKSPAAERCNRNTEEPACLSWREALRNTDRIHKMPGEKDERKSERCTGKTKLTITCCSWHSQERDEMFTSRQKLYSIWVA